MGLLEQINSEIERSGGIIRMGYTITNKEAPEWFDHKTKKHFQWQMGSLMYNLNLKALNRSERTWTDDQIEYLVNNWKRFHVELISKSVNKSVAAVRSKARAIMTPLEYKNRFYNRDQAAITYREKSKNWKRYKK